MGTRLDTLKMRETIEILSGERPTRFGRTLQARESVAARNAAALFIEDQLKQFGLSAHLDSFARGANVVAEVRGTSHPDEVLEIGAHYDSIERGADDNAAGVAVLLELARVFHAQPPERSVRFVFYDLEEVDSAGANHNVQRLRQDPRDFIGTIIVDAIGFYPSDLKEVVLMELGRPNEDRVHQGNLRLAHAMLGHTPLTDDIYLSAELGEIAGFHSDHGSYWDVGWPAILFSRPYPRRFNNPYNHTDGDSVANMNWAYFEKCARLFANLAASAARATEVRATLPQSYKDLNLSR